MIPRNFLKMNIALRTLILGLFAIASGYGFGSAEEHAGADAVIRSPRDLIAIATHERGPVAAAGALDEFVVALHGGVVHGGPNP